MVHMEVETKFIILAFVSVTYLVLGLMAMSPPKEQVSKKQLLSINKPAIMSFKTKYGDTLDCVEIHKQLAFDHPLLKNHSIQMRPTKYISSGHVKSSLFSNTQKILPRNIRCPKGTVLVRRIQKEEISMEDNAPLLWLSPTISRSHKFVSENADQPSQGHQVATLAMRTKNTGVQGNINIWGPEVGPNQFSSALIFAASDDQGSLQNYIAAGWSVNSALYPNHTRLHVFWTKDSGQTTGCFNLLCPGFVQVSQDIAPGIVLEPLSTFGGSQFEIPLSIRQDTTGNWWVSVGDKHIGYYPQQLFTTLNSGADGVGWGGEIASPTTEALPGMGSGYFPELGPGKACYISQMQLFSVSGQVIFPDAKSLINYVSKSECYKVIYVGDKGGQSGHYMFLGGPPNCKI